MMITEVEWIWMLIYLAMGHTTLSSWRGSCKDKVACVSWCEELSSSLLTVTSKSSLAAGKAVSVFSGTMSVPS